MKHTGFQKLFFSRTRRSTFIQYFLSYFVLFSVLLLGFYFILRNQVSEFYFEKLENEASAGLEQVAEVLNDDLASINHIQNAIGSNVELILFHHDNTPWNQYLAFQELDKYALGNRFIDSVVYLDKFQQTVLSTRRQVEYRDGIFYIYDEEDSVAFHMEEESQDAPYQLVYVSNGASDYLIYYPGGDTNSNYSVFFIINEQELAQIMKNALSEEIISMVLLAPPDNRVVTGANLSALEPYFAVSTDETEDSHGNSIDLDKTEEAKTSLKISLHVQSGLFGDFSMAALISNEVLLTQMNTAFRNTYLALLLLGIIGMCVVVLGMRCGRCGHGPGGDGGGSGECGAAAGNGNEIHSAGRNERGILPER